MDSTRNSIALAKRAAERVADAAMFVTPCYYRAEMSPQTLLNHYRTIADASPIPTIIYNMPIATAIDVDAATVIALAQHPNIVGIKDSGGNVAKFGEVIRAVRSDFSVHRRIGGTTSIRALRRGQGGGRRGGQRRPAAVPGDVRGLPLRAARRGPRAATQAHPLEQRGHGGWNIPGLKVAPGGIRRGLLRRPARLPLRPLARRRPTRACGRSWWRRGWC